MPLAQVRAHDFDDEMLGKTASWGSFLRRRFVFVFLFKTAIFTRATVLNSKIFDSCGRKNQKMHEDRLTPIRDRYQQVPLVPAWYGLPRE